MGTISDKLTYLNETKSQIRNGINAIGGDLTEENTFRSYVNALNNIYDYLPKITGSGTSVTLNNTTKGLMRTSLSASAMTQFTTTGKQLWNNLNVSTKTSNNKTYTSNGDGTFTLSGTASATSYFDLKPITLPAGTYKLTCGVSSGWTGSVVISIGGQAKICYAGGEPEFTLTEEATSTEHYIKCSSGDNSTYTIKPMIRLSSITDDTYEPYTNGASPNPSYPQDIHTISGNNTISVCGINIWDEQWEQGYIDASGTLISSTATIRTKNYISVQPNTSYYIYNGTNSDGRWTYYDKNKTWLGTATSVNTSKTTPNNCYFLKYSTGTSYGGTYNNDICINISNADINGHYYAYNGTDYSVDLGKNLLNVTATSITRYGVTYTINQDKSITLNGTNTGTTDWYRLSNNFTLPAGTYTLSNGNSNASTTNAIFYDDGYSFTQTNISTKTFTETKLIKPYLRVNANATFNNFTVYPMIEKGTQATSYAPYFTPIEYSKISTYEDKFIRNSGKNLFKFDDYNSTFVNVQIKTNGSSVYLSGTASSTDGITLGQTTLEAGTYKASFYGNNANSFRVNVRNKNNTSTSYGTLGSSQNFTFTLTETTTIEYRCYFSTANANSGMTYIQIEKGSTATDYEPYGSNEWYIKKNIGKVVLDGSESWVIFNSSSSKVTFRTSIEDIEGYTNANATPNMLSNRFIPATYNATWSVGNISRTTATGDAQTYVLLVYEPNTTVESFKTWLSSNNTIVYYVLATPTYTQITGTLAEELEAIYNAMSKNGQTNISQVNDDLPFVISASALEDLSSLTVEDGE